MVTQLGLGALIAVVVALGLLAAAAPLLPARAIAPATAGLAFAALALGLAALFAGGHAQSLGGAVAIGPIGAFFLLLPAMAGLAASCGALDRDMPPSMPGFIAAALLVILAADAKVAVLGISVFVLASSGWVPRLASLVGVFLLAAAFAVLVMGRGSDFTLIRAHPPEGMRAAVVLGLTLLGLAPLFGWVPWQTRPSAAPPGLLIAAVSPVTGLYLAIRILADLCGPATPEWWGLPVLLASAVLAGIGAVTALRSPGFSGILGGLAVQHGGWMLAGLGVAAAARGADVLPLATLALGGAMLHALNHTVFASLAGLSADAAATGAGSETLDRLGGLAVRMPLVAIGMLLAGLSLALLPPSAGFGSGWMLLQALFAAPRVGGLPLQLVVAAVAGVLGLAAGFGAVAAIRLGGLAFLGRPRTPRGAAAEDARPGRRITILVLMVLCGLLGVFPGAALSLAGAAQRAVTGAGLDGQGDWAGLRTQWDSPGYAALGIALLLGAGVAGIVALARAAKLPGALAVPAWEDGFASPPPWMPFGEPATQLTADALAGTLPRWPVALPAWPPVRLRVEGGRSSFGPMLGPRGAMAAILMLAVALLLVVAVLAPA